MGAKDLIMLVKTLLYLTFSCALLLCVFEGLASWWQVTSNLAGEWAKEQTTKGYTQFHRSLGWSPIPGFRDPDFYGPKIGVEISEQGFRHNGRVQKHLAFDQRRILCSGDSFTFGSGVLKEETWCEGLAKSLGPKVEAVNLGVSGYSVAQSILRYEIESPALQHHLHVFFTSSLEYNRLEDDSITYQMKDGEIKWDQVSESSKWAQKIRNNRAVFQGLEIYKVWEKFSKPRDEKYFSALRLLPYLKAISEKNGATLVLVYFPFGPENERDHNTQPYYDFLRQFAQESGTFFVDLADMFAHMSERERKLMHNPAPIRHYSKAGNTLIAKLIEKALKQRRLLTLGE